MQYLYILLLGLIIYYIISRYYENYRENFDPSLVPVSSIVTLAKVAQKLVDGGGTLTSPGNLTLGTPSAVGNLIVTGNNTTSGISTLAGATTIGVPGTPSTTTNLTLNGQTTMYGNLSVATKGPSVAAISLNTPGTGYTFYASDPDKKNEGGLVPNHLQLYAYNAGAPKDAYINQMIDMYPKYPGNNNNTINLNADTNIANSLNVGGNAKITGTSTLTGATTIGVPGTSTRNLTVNGQTSIYGGLSAATTGPNLATISLNTPGTGYTFFAADPAYTGGGGLSANQLQLFAYGAGAPPNASINQMLSMYPQNSGNPKNTVNLFADTNISNSLNVGGNVNITGQLNIVPRGSIMMWNGANIPAGWALCDGNQGTPDMQNRLTYGGSATNNGASGIRTGNGFAAINNGNGAIDHGIYVINFIMKL